MKDLVNKTALVTGSAKRIGRAIALALASRGANIALHYNTSAKEAEQTLVEIRRFGVKAEAFSYDLSSVKNCQSLIADVEKAFGGLDILVNNASTFPSADSHKGSFDLYGEDEESWDLSLNVNARAPFFLIKYSAKLLEQSENAVVINLLDTSVSLPFISRAAHSVSKSALAAINTIAAKTLYPKVRVNALELGAILPPEELKDSSHLEWGSVEDVCRAVNFIINSPFLTGQVIRLDGGELLKRDSID